MRDASDLCQLRLHGMGEVDSASVQQTQVWWRPIHRPNIITITLLNMIMMMMMMVVVVVMMVVRRNTLRRLGLGGTRGFVAVMLVMVRV